jgi:hypothetical protein
MAMHVIRDPGVLSGFVFRALWKNVGRKIANQNYRDKAACSTCSIIDFMQHLRYTPSRVPGISSHNIQIHDFVSKFALGPGTMF